MKSIISALLFVFLSTNIPALAWDYEDATQQLPYEEGLGTEEVPYIITNPQQLANLAWHVNHGTTYEGSYFVLGNDISLNPGVTFAADGSVASGTPKAWTPIGTEANPFKGNFDGKGHCIKGLYFAEPQTYTGLFGYVRDNKLSGITIAESGIYFPDIENSEYGYYIGMLAGYACDIVEISDCHNEAGITALSSTPDKWCNIGGLIANINSYRQKELLKITNCENKGAMKMNSGSHIGGLFGNLYINHSILNCTNYGNVSLIGGDYNYAGGIAAQSGYRETGSSLRNFGKIHCSGGGAGGIFGNGGYKTLQDCINEGDVTGYSYAGGICADGEIGNAIDCSNKGNIESLCEPEEPQGHDIFTNFQSPSGGLFGRINYVETITGCTNYGQVSSKGCAGGIAGSIADYSQEGSSVNNCTNDGTIKAGWAAGGIAAQINVENLNELYNNATVSGERDYVGGITGFFGTTGPSRQRYMSKCRNSADIEGREQIGGLVGSASSSADLSELSNTGNISGVVDVNGIGGGHSISLSYNLGKVTGTETVSGIGRADIIENCFNAGDISAESIAGGISSNARQTIRNVFNYGNIAKAEKEKRIGSIVGDAYWGVSDMTIENVFYLDGQATPVGGPYVTDDERMIAKSKEDFASGAVCVALNGEQSPTPWGQNVGVDLYPLLNGGGNPEINGVEDIKSVVQPERTIIVDLTGRHISAPVSSLKGFYIINGKKTFLH